MFCHYCGNRIPEDALFCNRCGRKIPSEIEQLPINIDGFPIGQPNLPPQPSSPEWLQIVQTNPSSQNDVTSFSQPTNSPDYQQISQQKERYTPLPRMPRNSKRPLFVIIGGVLAAIIIIGVAALSYEPATVPLTTTTVSLTTTTLPPTATTVPTVLDAPVQTSPANGTVFNNYPRSTTLEWNAVPGAFSYTVQVYYYQSGDTACTGGNLWYTEPGISGTSYTFNFVGAQPGCWQVWAVDSSGQQGSMSSLWEFSYTQ